MLNLRNEAPTPKAGGKCGLSRSKPPRRSVLTNVLTRLIVVSFDLEASRYIGWLLPDGLLPVIAWVIQLVTVNPRVEQLIGHRQYHGTDEDTD